MFQLNPTVEKRFGVALISISLTLLIALYFTVETNQIVISNTLRGIFVIPLTASLLLGFSVLYRISKHS